MLSCAAAACPYVLNTPGVVPHVFGSQTAFCSAEMLSSLPHCNPMEYCMLKCEYCYVLCSFAEIRSQVLKEDVHACAGLLKVLMSFEHGTLPGNLHFKEANPNNKSLKEGVIKVSGP